MYRPRFTSHTPSPIAPSPSKLMAHLERSFAPPHPILPRPPSRQCYQGSGLFVYTADSPMGPWTHQAPVGDVACQAPPDAYGGLPTPGQGCLYGGSAEVSVTRAQQDFLATLPDGNGGHTYLEIGSRWGQSPDGLKGHEPQ